MHADFALVNNLLELHALDVAIHLTPLLHMQSLVYTPSINYV